MQRRSFIILFAGAASWPITTPAQQKTMPVLGYLTGSVLVPALIDEFRKGLAQQGYAEGQNLAIEFRAAEGEYDRLPVLAAELVGRRVNVIVAFGGPMSGKAAKAATSGIPIVSLLGGDPVAEGLVDSFAHPGGNLTGVAGLSIVSDNKRLQLLHELVPIAAAIGYLQNSKLRRAEQVTRRIADAARTIGIKLSVFKASDDSELATAFLTMSQEGIGALLLGTDPYFFARREKMVSLSAQYKVPTMYFFREFVAAGGLVSYATSAADEYRQIGIYAGRVLNGERPADLPVLQRSEKIELVINLKTAEALGLTIPPSILARADEVIE
jgi:putative ABC transport system substrate-binding protein